MVAAVASAVLVLCGCTGGPASVTVTTGNAGTGRTTGAAAGSAADRVAAAIAADLNRYVTDEAIRAIIVTARGRTIFEGYYGGASAQQSRSVFSVTKSVMSVLVGQAVNEGRLRLDDRLATLLPGYAREMTPRVAAVTLRQLLTMTAGFADTRDGLVYREMEESKDWVRFSLAHQDGEPGQAFAYSDLGAHLLSPILEQATGQDVLSFARSHLFDPLGVSSSPALQPVAPDFDVAEFNRAPFAWAKDPQGITLGFTHLKLLPRDMAKVGQLLLQKGTWEGKQVVPAEWVELSTTAQAVGADPGYGFLWWVDAIDQTPTFVASGFGGQWIEVVPRHELVVVISTDVDLTTYRPTMSPDDSGRLARAIIRAAA